MCQRVKLSTWNSFCRHVDKTQCMLGSANPLYLQKTAAQSCTVNLFNITCICNITSSIYFPFQLRSHFTAPAHLLPSIYFQAAISVSCRDFSFAFLFEKDWIIHSTFKTKNIFFLTYVYVHVSSYIKCIRHIYIKMCKLHTYLIPMLSIIIVFLAL